MTNEMSIDYGKIGKQRFCNFCRTIKRLIEDKHLHFDLLIAAGNSGLAMARFAELIYQELDQKQPQKLQVPFFRYFPGHNDDPEKIFGPNVFQPEIEKQIESVGGVVKNVLFVDDEIGAGITALSIFKLLNQALIKAHRSRIEKYYIVAEDQGFKSPGDSPEIVFVPFDVEQDGYNNVIFLFTPGEFEDPIKGVLGDDDTFSFHWRTNVLLDLPLKDFNAGKPQFTDKYLKVAEENIPQLSKLQTDYLSFIKSAIKECLTRTDKLFDFSIL